MRNIVGKFVTIVNSLKMNFSNLGDLHEIVDESFTVLMSVAEVVIVVVTDEGVKRWLYLE